jgi:UDP-N-acetylglucosamine--N-acetylmuramyl-(pentapeptide) pyrophosphoryl-undecaprenol N-acetylglucosamine transferase
MIGAGGTGGHVYPALTAARVLSQQNHNLTFVGTRGGGGFEKRLVEESGIRFDAFVEVFAGPIAGIAPLRAAWNALLIGIGILQSIALLLRHRPQSILLTGGWANAPLAVAGWLLRVPMLVYLPDIEPGKTIQSISRMAEKVAVTVPDSAAHFPPGKTVVTGYPLRETVKDATREEAITHFKLDPTRLTLLVFGGSRGARSLNEAIVPIVPDLLADNMQILHVSGTLDAEAASAKRASLPDATHYHVFSYLEHDMGLALAAADLVLARSGASTLGEFPYFGLPSILVPYPYAWRYQKTNADYLVTHGAAVRLDDETLHETLLPTIRDLIHNPSLLTQMKAAARALAQPQGAENIARLMTELAGGQ